MKNNLTKPTPKKPITKTILVTGCTGFIGANFVMAYKKKYPNTTIIGISSALSKRANTDIPVVLYKGSLTDKSFVRGVFEKHTPEYVVHLAGDSKVSKAKDHPTETTELHVVATINLLELSRMFLVKRFVYASSVAVYDSVKKTPLKETMAPQEQDTFYGLQKITTEKFCKLFSKEYGLDTVSLRLFQTFGPFQYGYSSAISTWLEAIYFPKERIPFLEGDGSQARDFCYIDNTVDAMIKALHTKKAFNGESINIAGGESISLKDVIAKIELYSGKKLILERRPKRQNETKESKASILKAKELLGYVPKVSFDTGLKRTIAWFEKRKN
ncbi:MAG: hypothetical protein RI935_773 [Candidatus Parcubacteria bacterium]|jgi:UDP-glucose 4-epimerase